MELLRFVAKVISGVIEAGFIVLIVSVVETFLVQFVLEMVADNMNMADETVGTAGPLDWFVGLLLGILEVGTGFVVRVFSADNLLIGFIIVMFQNKMDNLPYYLLLLGMATDKLLIGFLGFLWYGGF